MALPANTSTSCTTSGSGVSSADELNLIVQGNYYGFPNRNRGRSDARQCTYHAPEEGNGADFTAPIHTFPAHCSCDGIAAYLSEAFGGSMQGDLVIAQLIFGNVVRVDLAPDGLSVSSVTTLQSTAATRSTWPSAGRHDLHRQYGASGSRA
jgi:glucose/arabinose dehydrogenase